MTTNKFMCFKFFRKKGQLRIFTESRKENSLNHRPEINCKIKSNP